MDRQCAFSTFFMGLLVVLSVCLGLFGCDSGKKAVDEVTGHNAVKQYHHAKKELSKIEAQQEKRYKDLQEQVNNQDEQR